METVAELQLEAIEPAVLLARDEAKAKGSPGPLRFAEAVDMEISPATEGTWHTLTNGDRLWRLRISAPGATDLNFGFTRYWLPDGATLHVVSDDGAYVEGPYDAGDNADHGELWTPVVKGSEAVLELYVPARVEEEVELVLGRVGRGYRDFFSVSDTTAKDHGSCNNDVICPEGNDWRNEIRSVARYVLEGSYLCTGTLLMDVPQSFTPFFLTAHHCEVTSANDQTVVVYWNYEAPTCGQQGGGSLNDNQTGAIWRAGRSDVDMTLLELEETPNSSSNVYYAGWDARSATRPGGSVAIHHPSGEVKSISFNDDPLSITRNCITGGTAFDTHWEVDDWEDGTTEPGSSGCGLWDSSTHLVVGYLSGGSASCTNPNGSDCFGRIASAWNGNSSSARLRDWLDPGGTGTQTVSGANPGGGGGTTTLTSGMPVSGSVGFDQWDYYTITVPSGATKLELETSQTTGDIDLYLRLGSAPTDQVFDYVAYTESGNESIAVTPSSSPRALVAGTWHVGVYGYEASPYFLLATLTGGGGGGANQLWVAVGASASGNNNTFWKTDLAVLNRGTSATNLAITVHTDSGAVTGNAQDPLPPGAQSFFLDVVGQLGVSKGAIQVASDQPILVTSRTYNDGGAAGTQGQYLDGVPASAGASAGQKFILMNLINNSSFRTNLGFQNMGTSTAQLSVVYYSSSGQRVGNKSFSLRAGKVDDRSAVFPSNTSGYAEVTVTSGSGVQGYASIVDNKTGDATTIPMKW